MDYKVVGHERLMRIKKPENEIDIDISYTNFLTNKIF